MSLCNLNNQGVRRSFTQLRIPQLLNLVYADSANHDHWDRADWRIVRARVAEDESSLGGSWAATAKQRLEKARDRGAIDEGTSEPRGCCARKPDSWCWRLPCSAIIDLIERVGAVLPAKALLTDVGSTKSAVAQQAQKVFGKSAGKRFLAGHPMAGKEWSGVDFADPDLFEKAVWFFTPLPEQRF